MTRVTNPEWVWCRCRFGLVLNSTPTKQPSQLPQDHLNATILSSGWKACRPLGSMSCALIPLQATHCSTESVAICRLPAVRGLINIWGRYFVKLASVLLYILLRVSIKCCDVFFWQLLTAFCCRNSFFFNKLIPLVKKNVPLVSKAKKKNTGAPADWGAKHAR